MAERERNSRSDTARQRAAFRDLLPGLVVLVLTEGSLIVADPDASSSPWALAWSLSPLIAVGLLVWGQLRILRRSDERERLVQLGAMAVGFGTFAVLLAASGVLQAADIGDPAQQSQITFAAGILAWVGATAVAQRTGS